MNDVTRIDALGAQITSGALVLEHTGFSMGGGAYYHLYKVYEVPETYPDDSMGYHYSLTGNRCEFWHIRPTRGVIVQPNEAPDEFLYSFRHGLSNFEVEVNGREGSSIGNAASIIARSDWKERRVHKRDVELAQWVDGLVIDSFDKLLELKRICAIHRFAPSMKIIHETIRFFGLNPVRPVNGELGLAHMTNYELFSRLMATLDEKGTPDNEH